MSDALSIYEKHCDAKVRKNKKGVYEIAPGVALKPRVYKYYREQSLDNDIALFTPTGYFGRAIARHTGEPGYGFSHVEGVIEWPTLERLMSCGYEEGKGGTARPLSARVEESNGCVHIFRVREGSWDRAASEKYNSEIKQGPPEVWQSRLRWFNGQLKADVSKNLGGSLGYKYNWSAIWLQFANLLPFIRFIVWLRFGSLYSRLVSEASKNSKSGICSQHIARSFANAGLSLINKSLAMVTPNDVAQSAVLEYYCTLVMEPQEKKGGDL